MSNLGVVLSSLETLELSLFLLSNYFQENGYGDDGGVGDHMTEENDLHLSTEVCLSYPWTWNLFLDVLIWFSLIELDLLSAQLVPQLKTSLWLLFIILFAFFSRPCWCYVWFKIRSSNPLTSGFQRVSQSSSCYLYIIIIIIICIFLFFSYSLDKRWFK